MTQRLDLQMPHHPAFILCLLYYLKAPCPALPSVTLTIREVSSVRLISPKFTSPVSSHLKTENTKIKVTKGAVVACLRLQSCSVAPTALNGSPHCSGAVPQSHCPNPVIPSGSRKSRALQPAPWWGHLSSRDDHLTDPNCPLLQPSRPKRSSFLCTTRKNCQVCTLQQVAAFIEDHRTKATGTGRDGEGKGRWKRNPQGAPSQCRHPVT